VGTATFGNPTAAIKIKNELQDLLIERKFENFNDAVGFAHRLERM
jgi:dihydroorotate dehydrogenase (NAD+) catalytic subunit